jgi:hypothetical protein
MKKEIGLQLLQALVLFVRGATASCAPTAGLCGSGTGIMKARTATSYGGWDTNFTWAREDLLAGADPTVVAGDGNRAASSDRAGT